MLTTGLPVSAPGASEYAIAMRSGLAVSTTAPLQLYVLPVAPSTVVWSSTTRAVVESNAADRFGMP